MVRLRYEIEKIKDKTPIFVAKTRIYDILPQKFMITHSSITFEDFLGSSIAPQVMPPWSAPPAPAVVYFFQAGILCSLVMFFGVLLQS